LDELLSNAFQQCFINCNTGGIMKTFLALILIILPISYSAAITISGTVITCKQDGISGVTITFSNSKTGPILTDSLGNFSISLPSGWSGTAAPSKSGGYFFVPDTIKFIRVTTDQTCSFLGGTDQDGDGVWTECDNCPSTANKDQSDGDKDGIGDVCDNCPKTSNANQADIDKDGVGDKCDNCPNSNNPNQTDTDRDGVGDVCDIQPQPTLISPENNSIDQPYSLPLVWNSVAEAITYRVQVSTSSYFTSPFVDDSTITSTSTAIGPLSLGILYYWRVSEKNAGGTSEWSPTWNFTTIASVPNQVMLLSPANSSTVGYDSVKFAWAKASPAVTFYELNLIGDSTTMNYSYDTTITLRIPSSGIQKNYSWKVRAVNSAGYGVFSDIWSFSKFTTNVSEFNSQPEEFVVFQNYPNPFNPSTNFSFSLPSRLFVSLKIFDLSGKEVATIVSKELPAGTYTQQWNATQQPSGIYFCRLQTGSSIETKKLVLLK
jgi:hypothetical protein